MKAIINGRMYNTDTAQEVGGMDSGHSGRDYRHYAETLYRKRTGEYFIEGQGGPMSKYAEACGDMTSGSHRLRPLSDAEAREWAEQYLTADEYVAAFGPVDE